MSYFFIINSFKNCYYSYYYSYFKVINSFKVISSFIMPPHDTRKHMFQTINIYMLDHFYIIVKFTILALKEDISEHFSINY